MTILNHLFDYAHYHSFSKKVLYLGMDFIFFLAGVFLVVKFLFKSAGNSIFPDKSKIKNSKDVDNSPIIINNITYTTENHLHVSEDKLKTNGHE